MKKLINSVSPVSRDGDEYHDDVELQNEKNRIQLRVYSSSSAEKFFKVFWSRLFDKYCSKNNLQILQLSGNVN